MKGVKIKNKIQCKKEDFEKNEHEQMQILYDKI